MSGSVVKLFLKIFGHVLLNGFGHGALYGIGAKCCSKWFVLHLKRVHLL